MASYYNRLFLLNLRSQFSQIGNELFSCLMLGMAQNLWCDLQIYCSKVALTIPLVMQRTGFGLRMELKLYCYPSNQKFPHLYFSFTFSLVHVKIEEISARKKNRYVSATKHSINVPSFAINMLAPKRKPSANL